MHQMAYSPRFDDDSVDGKALPNPGEGGRVRRGWWGGGAESRAAAEPGMVRKGSRCEVQGEVKWGVYLTALMGWTEVLGGWWAPD